MDAQDRRARFEELTQQENGLELLKDSLQKQLQEAEEQLRALRLEKASLAPVNVLPDDVLVQVLELLYLHDFPHCRTTKHDHPLHSPLTISHVSRRWRSLALSLPNIWKCVHITRHQPPRYHRIIELYLTRSRTAPLSLFFVTLGTDFDSQGLGVTWSRFSTSHHWQRLWECWRMLRTQVHRWKHCALYFILPEVMDLIQETLADANMPLLQFLQVYIWPALDLHPSTLSLAWAAPGLTHIRLYNVITPLLRPLLQSVVELTIHEALFTMDSLNMLSNAAPHLMILIFSDIMLEQEDAEESQVVFPALRRLSLDCSELDMILPSLQAPHLEMLSISRPDIIGGEPCSVDSSNFPALRELRCIDCPMSKVTHLLSGLSGVVTLNLGHSDAAEYLIFLLDAVDTLLPNLQTLVLSKLEGDAPGLLRDIVEARSRLNCPIRSVHFGPPLSLSMSRDVIKPLESAGVTIWYTMCPDFPREMWNEDDQTPSFHRSFTVATRLQDRFDYIPAVTPAWA